MRGLIGVCARGLRLGVARVPVELRLAERKPRAWSGLTALCWAGGRRRPCARRHMDPQGHHPLVLVRRHHALRHLELDLVAQQPQLLRLRRPRRPGRRRHTPWARPKALAPPARSNYETQKVF